MISSNDLTCLPFWAIYPRPTKVYSPPANIRISLFSLLHQVSRFRLWLVLVVAGRAKYETILLYKTLGKLKICHTNKGVYFSSTEMTLTSFWALFWTSLFPLSPASQRRHERSTLDAQTQYFKGGGVGEGKLVCSPSVLKERIEYTEFF